jgi:ferredoxin/flavodoxin
MRIAIIQFSPSGNTLKVSEMLKNELEQKGQDVQFIDITREKQLFIDREWSSFLAEKVVRHDVLLIGSPVYAHHLQYHMKDLLQALPKPDQTWGKYAVPYVTYGGISSGIALKEAAGLLRKSGRKVPAGMKISTSHRMTRAFMEKEFNRDLVPELSLQSVRELVNRIMQMEGRESKSNHKSLDYNGLVTTLKANIIFKEKLWHEKRYPKVSIDRSLCIACGKCSKVCPVLHLCFRDKLVTESSDSSCIHCLNCVTECPQKAVKLMGDLEKGRSFMKKMIEKNGNREQPATAVYPLVH